MEYKTGSSTKHRVLVHLVWCPKYRRRILRGKIARRINELFTQCCEMNDWEIHELGIQHDHIHMLIQINPRESIAKVVNLIKGGSSRVIRQEFLELEEFLWGDSLWCDGYFVETIGSKNESVIKKYIRSHNKSST